MYAGARPYGVPENAFAGPADIIPYKTEKKKRKKWEKGKKAQKKQKKAKLETLVNVNLLCFIQTILYKWFFSA